MDEGAFWAMGPVQARHICRTVSGLVAETGKRRQRNGGRVPSWRSWNHPSL